MAGALTEVEAQQRLKAIETALPRSAGMVEAAADGASASITLGKYKSASLGVRNAGTAAAPDFRVYFIRVDDTGKTLEDDITNSSDEQIIEIVGKRQSGGGGGRGPFLRFLRYIFPPD